MKSLKTVNLTILTLFFYGFFFFLKDRRFIFPIPANDFILIIICTYLIYLERDRLRETLLFLGFSLFILLQNPYNYEILLNSSQIMGMENLNLFYIFELISILFFTLLLVQLFLKNKTSQLKYLLFIPFILFYLCKMNDDFWNNFFEFCAYFSLTVICFLFNRTKIEEQKIYFFSSISLLLMALSLSSFLTIYIF